MMKTSYALKWVIDLTQRPYVQISLPQISITTLVCFDHVNTNYELHEGTLNDSAIKTNIIWIKVFEILWLMYFK